jgi:hypothetical protein
MSYKAAVKTFCLAFFALSVGVVALTLMLGLEAALAFIKGFAKGALCGPLPL